VVALAVWFQDQLQVVIGTAVADALAGHVTTAVAHTANIAAVVNIFVQLVVADTALCINMILDRPVAGPHAVIFY
jgi:hypothetical protein